MLKISLLFTDYIVAQRNRVAFAQLPFANGFHDDKATSKIENLGFSKPAHVNGFSEGLFNRHGMDCNENKAPNHWSEPEFHAKTSQSGFPRMTNTCDKEELSQMDRGQFLGEISQNRQEPFSCLKFKEPPVKCQSFFMSHYI